MIGSKDSLSWYVPTIYLLLNLNLVALAHYIPSVDSYPYPQGPTMVPSTHSSPK